VILSPFGLLAVVTLFGLLVFIKRYIKRYCSDDHYEDDEE